MLSQQFFLLILAGVGVGVFATTVGGAMFVSIPVVQLIFPQATLGAVVGNIKVSSFFRGFGSTASTWKSIDVWHCLRVAPALFAGTALGAVTISHIDQRWLLPAVILAIFVTMVAPQYAAKVTPRSFLIFSFAVGFYTGVLGAGIGILLVALMRLKFPADAQIAHVKLQARFVEWLTAIVAVGVHLAQGNLVTSLWMPLSVGTLLGGYVGGLLLHKMGSFSGRVQKNILYAAFMVDLVVATNKFLE